MVTAIWAVVCLAPISGSKLSIQMLDDRYSPGAQQIVAAGPRVLKLFDVGQGMRRALKDYKTQYPHGTVVVRVWTTLKWTLNDDPELAGRAFWEQVLAKPFHSLTDQERAWIDYWEGPNEGDSTPTWATVDDTRWFARFWVSLAKTMQANGARPNIGSIPVGNPGGEKEEFASKVQAFVPAFEAAREARGSWGYHAYTIEYTTDPAKESWYPLRYRRIHRELARIRPDLADLPLILTEGGVDKSGNRYEDGWVSRGSAAQYQTWLRWFDGEMRKDPYVVGLTLFQSGAYETWPSFEIEAIAPWLAQYLRDARN